MDLDADGKMDVITGSYWPGNVYWFRGLGKGEFAAGEMLKDVDGKDLHAGEPWKTDDDPDMRSLAAVPVVLDWDGDGDLDLLVGNISGTITRIDNVGDKAKPVFAKERHEVHAGGKAIRVDGDAGPALADWDGDGKVDLLVGSDAGSVVFCRNVTAGKTLQFAAPVELLGKSKQAWDSIPVNGEPKGPGVRVKVHAADYNGDGQLDLLVGDYVQQAVAEPELTDEQTKEREALREERDAVQGKLQKIYEGATAKSLEDNAELKGLQKDMSRIYGKLRPLEAQPESHGFTWVYLRKKDAATPSGQ